MGKTVCSVIASVCPLLVHYIHLFYFSFKPFQASDKVCCESVSGTTNDGLYCNTDYLFY